MNERENLVVTSKLYEISLDLFNGQNFFADHYLQLTVVSKAVSAFIELSFQWERFTKCI